MTTRPVVSIVETLSKLVPWAVRLKQGEKPRGKGREEMHTDELLVELGKTVSKLEKQLAEKEKEIQELEGQIKIMESIIKKIAIEIWNTNWWNFASEEILQVWAARTETDTIRIF